MDDVNFDRETALEWIRIVEDPSASIRGKDLYPILQSWVSKSSAKNILEIGCGQGVCSTQLGNSEVCYIGIDPSIDLINRAKELFADAAREFVEGNAYALPFKGAFFNAAFSVAVWHLLSDLSIASGELARVLTNNGHFLIVTADPDQYQSWIAQYQEGDLMGRLFIGSKLNSGGTIAKDRLYLHTLDEIVSALNAEGLQVSSLDRFRLFVAVSGCKKV